MTKHGNTIIFIILAAGFNIILTGLVFIFMFFLFFFFIRPLISDNFIVFVMPVIFILSILVSFTIYRLLLKLFLSNVDMDKYFDSTFSFKKMLSSKKTSSSEKKAGK